MKVKRWRLDCSYLWCDKSCQSATSPCHAAHRSQQYRHGATPVSACLSAGASLCVSASKNSSSHSRPRSRIRA
jgi:hypothetical protein